MEIYNPNTPSWVNEFASTVEATLGKVSTNTQPKNGTFVVQGAIDSEITLSLFHDHENYATSTTVEFSYKRSGDERLLRITSLPETCQGLGYTAVDCLANGDSLALSPEEAAEEAQNIILILKNNRT